MRLFQIEEPEGGPADPELPGVAIGIDLGGAEAELAFSVGGNAVVLTDRSGFEQTLSVPDPAAPRAQWQELFEGVRLRAERALARPVDFAVVVVAAADAATSAKLRDAAAAAALTILRIVAKGELPLDASAALTAAMLAEDLAPRPK